MFTAKILEHNYSRTDDSLMSVHSIIQTYSSDFCEFLKDTLRRGGGGDSSMQNSYNIDFDQRSVRSLSENTAHFLGLNKESWPRGPLFKNFIGSENCRNLLHVVLLIQNLSVTTVND